MRENVYTFLKGISLKVNVIAWQEFKFIYYDVAVQHVSYYAMETSHPEMKWRFKQKKKKKKKKKTLFKP